MTGTTTTPPPVATLPPPTIDTVDVNGVTRYYSYVDPDPTAPDPLPLVFAFHGGGGTMAIIARALGFDALPAPRPYITVIPQGYDPWLQTGAPTDGAGTPADGVWNSGQAYMPYQDPTGPPQDDLAFVDALLLEMTSVAAANGRRIDQDRTYAIGFSNGGMMAHRLAVERSSEFAAIAVMQASIGGDPDPADPTLPFHINNPADHGADPVALLQLHGLLDTNVLLNDGHIPAGPSPRSDLPVIDAVDAWVAHNNCDLHPSLESHAMGLMRTWGNGDDDTEVKLLTMPAVGHQVPEGVMHLIEPFLLSHSK